jgi:hypothetical protein
LLDSHADRIATDCGMIGKIENAMRYAEERNRILKGPIGSS